MQDDIRNIYFLYLKAAALKQSVVKDMDVFMFLLLF